MARNYQVYLGHIVTAALTGTRKITPKKTWEGTAQLLERGFSWMGSIVGTGIPNLVTMATISGSAHDNNVLTTRAPAADGGHSALADRLNKGTETCIADPEILCGLVQAGTSAFQYDWHSVQSSRFPSFLFRTTQVFTLAYGAHPLNPLAAKSYNVRPFLSLTAAGGSEYGTVRPANIAAFAPATPESWGDSIVTSSPLVYAHEDCYREAWFGAVADYGLNVSQKSKNHVIGDTGSTPSSDRYAYGYAFPEYSDDQGRVATYDSKIGRYFHAGDLSGDQRVDSNKGSECTYLTHYNPYCMIAEGWSSAEDGWDYFNAYAQTAIFGIAAVRGLSEWIDDTTGTWHIPTPWGGTFVSGSFADNRVRNTIIAEFASPGRDQDNNIITHAGLAANIANNSVPDAATLDNQYGSLYLSNQRQFTVPVVARCLRAVRLLCSHVAFATGATGVQRADLPGQPPSMDKWLFARGALCQIAAYDGTTSSMFGNLPQTGIARGEACVPYASPENPAGVMCTSFNDYQIEAIDESATGYHFIKFTSVLRSTMGVSPDHSSHDAGLFSPYVSYGIDFQPQWQKMGLPQYISHRSWGSSTAPVQTKCEDKSTKLAFTRCHAARRPNLVQFFGLYNNVPSSFNGAQKFVKDLYSEGTNVRYDWSFGGTIFRTNNFIAHTEATPMYWQLSGQVPGIWLGKALWAEVNSSYLAESYSPTPVVAYTFGKHLAVGIQNGGKL